MKTNNNSINKELEKIAPELIQHRYDTPFTTPEGYFSELPNAILQKTVKHKIQDRTFYLSAPLFKYAAAILIIVSMVGLWHLSTIEKESTWADSQDAFQDKYLIWYAEYQPEVLYDLYGQDYIDETSEISQEQEDKFWDNYLMYYSNYHPALLYDFLED